MNAKWGDEDEPTVLPFSSVIAEQKLSKLYNIHEKEFSTDVKGKQVCVMTANSNPRHLLPCGKERIKTAADEVLAALDSSGIGMLFFSLKECV